MTDSRQFHISHCTLHTTHSAAGARIPHCGFAAKRRRRRLYTSPTSLVATKFRTARVMRMLQKFGPH